MPLTARRCLLVLLGLTGATARAQPAEADGRLRALEERVRTLEAAAATPPSSPPAGGPRVTVGGDVETYVQWNVGRPSNGVTAARGFDDRNASLTLENVVVDLAATTGPVSAHLAVQWGAAGEAYYAAEPVWRATGGAGASGPEVWKHVQQANLAWVAPLGRGLKLEGGLFLSPIGPETLAIKDQWNWSHSNLFFALPYYHTGVRLTYPVTDAWSVSLQGYDGWNSVVNDNPEFSLAAQVTYTSPDRLSWSALYFGGVERPRGAPEGRPWRHLLDTYVTWFATERLSLGLHVDGGFEPNAFGTSGWAATALAARLRLVAWLFVAARADVFREWIAANGQGRATPIFWGGVRWVASGTLTLEARVREALSVRLEYRHDQADTPLYFRGTVPTDAQGRDVANARAQDTVTLGATAWF